MTKPLTSLLLLLVCISLIETVQAHQIPNITSTNLFHNSVQVMPTETANVYRHLHANMSNFTFIDAIHSTGAWIASVAQEQGPWVMVLAVMTTDSVPLMPTQPIAIIAGAVYKLPKGLLAIIIGQSLATAFCILVGRYIIAKRHRNQRRSEYATIADTDLESCAEDLATNTKQATSTRHESKLTRVLEEMTIGLNSKDYKTVFGTILLLRQSPVLPFSLGNYFIGASTEAPVLLCVLANMIGCLPLNFIWVGAGAGGTAAFDALEDDNERLKEGLEVIGSLATAAMVLFCAKIIWKVWQEEHKPDDHRVKVEEEIPLISTI